MAGPLPLPPKQLSYADVVRQMTDAERWSNKYASCEHRVRSVFDRLGMGHVKIEGTLLWDFTDAAWVKQRHATYKILDSAGKPSSTRDSSNMRVRKSAESKYEGRFLREGFYKDLRGRFQGIPHLLSKYSGCLGMHGAF